ncbi:uncharacterized protein LOC122019489 [Zingiber officinale]|uniref:uncharacterized protein LOC122019489 n=1 Tax=Zingiber officinale TaxID=94328 RepID=UPI001C4BECDA|nr:uncharacterized protein LOC122019489 [Zingiber officinale]
MDRLGSSKHSAKNIRARIGPIRSKKQATVQWLKKDVANLIAAGHEANAYGRFSDIRTSGSDYSISTYEGRQKSHHFCRSLPLIIEDPFKRMENATRTVRWVELPKISNAFQNAHNKLSSGSITFSLMQERDLFIRLCGSRFLMIISNWLLIFLVVEIERIEEILAMSNGKFNCLCHCIVSLWTELCNNWYIRWAIHHAGFSKHEDEKWLRNLMTRSIAITPSLIVSIISGSSGAERLIIISSMVLSFELPFALLSLLKFSSSQTKMGPHKSSIYIIVVSWILGLLRVAINIYFLSTSFVSWLIDSSLPAIANVLINIIVFPLMVVYILTVIYLTFRKETEVTFVDPLNSSHVNIESGGLFQVDGMSRFEVAPVREDRADIPLPD